MVGLLIAAILPVFPCLAVVNTSAGAHNHKIIFCKRAKDAEEFRLSFTHSVNKTPVTDYFKIENGHLLLYKTTFTSYGAGMPEYNPNQQVTLENGQVVISNIDTAYDTFSVFVGDSAEHMLIIDQYTLPLRRLAPPKSTLSFSVRYCSLWQILASNRRNA